MNEKPLLPAPVHSWTIDSLPSDVKERISRLAMTEGVRQIAVMPDVHLANEVCVGTVVATEEIILPGAIGGDIGCGMATIALDAPATLLSGREAASQLMSELYARVPTLRHARGSRPELPLSISPSLTFPQGNQAVERDGRLEFATLGSGNHFLEFQADDDDRLWIMVHSGSRCMGQVIATHHAKAAGKTETGIQCLIAASPAGAAFLADMTWAMTYARESRRAILQACVEAMHRLFGITGDPGSYLDSPHNMVRLEEVAGRSLWVHRKGAISVRTGEIGMVPGSMGSSSFHVVGRDCPDALFSSAHGAGRSRSRTDARRQISTRSFLESMKGIWFDHRHSHRLLDEAPAAYKDILAVMRAQNALVRIVRRLRPILNFKGAS